MKEELKIARIVFQASIYPVILKEPEEEEGIVTIKGGEAILSSINVTLLQLLSEYTKFVNIFNPNGTDNFFILSAIKYYIDLINGTQPPQGLIYALSTKELDILKVQLNKAEVKGQIRLFISLINAPILFILKKGGELYLIINFRTLNRFIYKNRTPLPLISEILNRLLVVKIYTKLNLRNIYYRV